MARRNVALALLSVAACAHAFTPPGLIAPALRAGSTTRRAGSQKGILSPSCGGTAPRQLRGQRALRPGGRASGLAMSTLAETATPSWEQLQSLVWPEPAPPAPVLTLYRDTNGWCPFCEKVWIQLLAKGIPFDEKLIPLHNRPQWYRDKVPTALVPGIEFTVSGDVAWESRDILLLLEDDERLASYPSLLPAAEREHAIALLDSVRPPTATIWQVNVSAVEIGALAAELEEGLDRIEALLGASASPFFLSSGFSIVDCSALPVMERLAMQAPIKTGFAVRDPQRWPNIDRWYAACEAEVPRWADRVRGDTYSWAANLARISGIKASTVGPDGRDAVTAALGHAAAELERQLAAPPAAAPPAARQEAARKLLANHEAVVLDATSGAQSQERLARLAEADRAYVDRALRRAAALLLAEGAGEERGLLEGVTDAEARAARLVASRLSVPRDMGAPAAAALRASLGSVAHAHAAS